MLEFGDEIVLMWYVVVLLIGVLLFLLFVMGMMLDYICWVGLSYGIGVFFVCVFIIV